MKKSIQFQDFPRLVEGYSQAALQYFREELQGELVLNADWGKAVENSKDCPELLPEETFCGALYLCRKMQETGKKTRLSDFLGDYLVQIVEDLGREVFRARFDEAQVDELIRLADIEGISLVKPREGHFVN